MLQHGASLHKVDKDMKTPLHLAAHHGKTDLLAWILENFHFDTKMVTNQGRTILHVAALNGRSECCSVILKHDSALINMKNIRGRTPLALACQTGHKVGFGIFQIQVCLGRNIKTI